MLRAPFGHYYYCIQPPPRLISNLSNLSLMYIHCTKFLYTKLTKYTVVNCCIRHTGTRSCRPSTTPPGARPLSRAGGRGIPDPPAEEAGRQVPPLAHRHGGGQPREGKVRRRNETRQAGSICIFCVCLSDSEIFTSSRVQYVLMAFSSKRLLMCMLIL